MLKFYILQGLIILSGALIPIINLIDFPSLASNDNTPSPASGVKSTNVSENKTGNGSNSESKSNMTVRVLSSTLASIIVIATSFIQLTKAHQSWLLFRETVESLKREYHLFCNKAGDYLNPILTEEQRNKLL